MASSEDGLWEWLRDVVLPLGHYSRIESPTSPGFPDVHYEILLETPLLDECVSGTIELKHCNDLEVGIPFKNEDDGLHKSQRIWIRDAVRQKANVWIFAEVSPRVFLIQGKHADRFNGASIPQLREMATDILSIREPKGAAKKLAYLLTTPQELI